MAMSGCQHVATNHHQDESAQQQQGGQRANSQNVENRRSIPALPWIVVIAIEQHLVGQVSDLALRRLDQPHLDVARKILDPVVVLRQPAVRRQQHDAGSMSELFVFRVPLVAKTYGRGQSFNLVLASRQEVPALFSARPPVARQVTLLVGGCALRGVAGIEADRDHVEVAADIEAHNPVERADQMVLNFRAQHRTLVINQRQDHRFRSEVLAKLYRLCALIGKDQIQRDLLVQPLLDPDLIQDCQLRVCTALAGLHLWRRLRRRTEPDADQDKARNQKPPYCATSSHFYIHCKHHNFTWCAAQPEPGVWLTAELAAGMARSPAADRAAPVNPWRAQPEYGCFPPRLFPCSLASRPLRCGKSASRRHRHTAGAAWETFASGALPSHRVRTIPGQARLQPALFPCRRQSAPFAVALQRALAASEDPSIAPTIPSSPSARPRRKRARR